MSKKPPIPASVLRRISVEASVDPRTMRKIYNEGGPIRTMASERAKAALIAAGYWTEETNQAQAD